MSQTTGSLLADRTTIEFDAAITEAQLGQLALDPHLKVLQFAAPVPESVWILLNASFFSLRPYSGECDLKFARHMTNVRRFTADCLIKAQNVGCIAEIPPLDSLSVGIFELRDSDFLKQVSPTLKALYLGPTRSGAPSLAPIARFPSLRTLNIDGHSKGIDVLSGLQLLEDVTLRSVTTPDLRYLAPLTHLWSLDIKLGGIRSFAGAEGKASIKYLERWQIRGLFDAGIVSTLPGLQNLFLQALPNVETFPSVGNAVALRRVTIYNLKGLRDLTTLEEAPALEEFALLDGKAQSPEQLLPVLRNANVRIASAFFGSKSKNLAFSQLRKQYEKQEPIRSWQSHFDYR